MKNCELFKLLLTPPGNGVYTVHTAADKKQELHKKIYQESEPAKVAAIWEESIDSYENNPQNILLGDGFKSW